MQADIKLRQPQATDGIHVYRLVEACPPLDMNSAYCNLLQCSHFAGTSVAAEAEGEVVGFLSGYLIPERNDTLFLWQAAVGEKARGQGLAARMVKSLLERDNLTHVKYIETTITEDNEASWALFRSVAKRLNAELNSSVMFDRDTHFDGEHATEMLVRIGPF